MKIKTEIKELQSIFIELRDDMFESVKNKSVDTFKIKFASMDVDGQEHYVPFLREITKKQGNS